MPPCTKVLVIGATSGIGLSLASRLAKEGAEVIVTGRRAALLADFVAAHPGKAHSAVLDVLSGPSTLGAFVAETTRAHPDIDLVVFNAGVQRGFDFSSPGVDLDVLQAELATNYTSVVTLFTQLLSHLTKPERKVDVVLISATLGLVPTMIRTAGYNASKAALHSRILNVREQLFRNPKTQNLKLLEVFPPAVQTGLHDEKHQPDLVDGGQIGMPLEAFTEAMWQGLLGGEDEVYVGDFPLAARDGFEKKRGKMYRAGIGHVEKALAAFMKSQ